MTKSELQTRMLSEISDEYDKSEGSFFADAVAPVAIELEKSYTAQTDAMASAFVDTSSGAYLDRKCAELGVNKKESTKATVQVEIVGAVGANIAQGTLVATELVTFATTQAATIGATGIASVAIECTQAGAIGNVPANTIRFFQISLESLSSVANSAVTIGGYDTESDDSLRQRYFEKANAPATSGNAAHYKQWAKEVAGVGDAKVIPVWNGPGTVKVVICDSDKRAVGA